jgi:hypothetical protein
MPDRPAVRGGREAGKPGRVDGAELVEGGPFVRLGPGEIRVGQLTGGQAGDQALAVLGVVVRGQDEQLRRIALDMMAEATRNPELGTALRDAVAGPRRGAAASVLSRGSGGASCPKASTGSSASTC